MRHISSKAAELNTDKFMLSPEPGSRSLHHLATLEIVTSQVIRTELGLLCALSVPR